MDFWPIAPALEEVQKLTWLDRRIEDSLAEVKAHTAELGVRGLQLFARLQEILDFLIVSDGGKPGLTVHRDKVRYEDTPRSNGQRYLRVPTERPDTIMVIPEAALSWRLEDIKLFVKEHGATGVLKTSAESTSEPVPLDVLASDVFQDVADRLSALMQRNKTESDASFLSSMTDAEIRDVANQFSASFEKNKTEPASTIDEMSQYFTKRGIEFWVEEDDKETRLIRKFNGLVPMHFVYTWPKD